MGQWHTAEEYDGQVREITFRSLCNSPMCPPDTAITEWQHVVLSSDKKNLVRLLHIKKNSDNDDFIILISFFGLDCNLYPPPPPHPHTHKKKKIHFTKFKLFDGTVWLLLGVWDCATGTRCSTRVLFWGTEYLRFHILIFSCYCYFFSYWDY